MKWNEMTNGEKILFVISLISGVAYFILTLLDIFNVWAAPKPIAPAFFGTFWICDGFLLKNKKLAICYYILGAVWFLFSLSYLMMMVF